jgi:hypothetical protein
VKKRSPVSEKSTTSGTTGARVAEEDKVVARRHLGQAVLLAPSLDLQEGDESANLILYPLKADERRELLLELDKRARRILPAWFDLLEPIGRRTKRTPDLLTD